MRSLWNNKDAGRCGRDLLALRVYTSRLLGRDPCLVMHGGGNTSVKTSVRDFFGLEHHILYIKGSGGDLATIEAQGFAAVKMDALLRLACMKQLTDTRMVSQQRAAMLDPQAPNPSVESILHAIIPYAYVDHSHADAVVTITNTPQGEKRIRALYGNRVLVVPYVMPGFLLARQVFEMTRSVDWTQYEGIVLLNHGLFTFADSAKESYEKHIKLVTEAEKYIAQETKNVFRISHLSFPRPPRRFFAKQNWRGKRESSLLPLAQLRRAVSRVQGGAVIALYKDDQESVAFSRLPNIHHVARRGTLTPDHVIRIKPAPIVLQKDMDQSIDHYAGEYRKYFDRHTNGKLKCLDPAPRWAVWPGQGVVAFGRSPQECAIVSDIIDHAMQAVRTAEAMGGWRPVAEKDLFEVEYWELEQAKLLKNPKPLAFQGKVALVTGAASGIGKACVEKLLSQGACVVGLDIHTGVIMKQTPAYLGLRCDVTKEPDVKKAVESVVNCFGGLDIVVSNAGNFPPSRDIASMDQAAWERSLKLNLTSHELLMKAAVPYLVYGLDPTMIIIASKNVPAPGPGAAAYSVAKAGLTQLGRVAALELGSKGIRVNMVHPNQVFDTSIWTKDVLEKRARHYGLTVDEYKTNNVLQTEITSKDVADLVCAMAGPAFAKTTGAQIPIDGGNERVI